MKKAARLCFAQRQCASHGDDLYKSFFRGGCLRPRDRPSN